MNYQLNNQLHYYRFQFLVVRLDEIKQLQGNLFTIFQFFVVRLDVKRHLDLGEPCFYFNSLWCD